MDDREILALYDQDERIEVEYPRARREVDGPIVRHVDTAGGTGMILYARLDDATADTVIEAQIAYYEGIGQDFEWKVFDYDPPADLKTRLARRRFEIEDEDEALLILPVDEAPAALLAPVPACVRRVTTPADVHAALAVQAQVWGHDYTDLGNRLASDLAERPGSVSMYVAEFDGIPVSSAWLYATPGSRFAGLWGGSTLPAYRGKGIYTALVAARVQEARERGIRFLTIDASPMSRPIVQKHGFRFMALTTPCRWKVRRGQAG